MKKVKIFSKKHCPFCDQALALAQREGHEVEKLMLDIDFTLTDLAKLFPWARSFPQIQVDGEYIGGFDEFKLWVNSNK